MNEEEFEVLLNEANSELRAKQEVLQTTYGLSTYARWWFEQDQETLQFFDSEDKLRLEADVVHIGSHSSKSNTWLWSWANVSILPKLREKGEPLRALEAITGYQLFGEFNTFEADEPMAWELTAIAVKHLQARGCYRAPSSDGSHQSFLALMSIRTVQ
ncbi:MAG: DUF6882 domain-containing protein [Moraxellaceae bacterium]